MRQPDPDDGLTDRGDLVGADDGGERGHGGGEKAVGVAEEPRRAAASMSESAVSSSTSQTAETVSGSRVAPAPGDSQGALHLAVESAQYLVMPCTDRRGRQVGEDAQVGFVGMGRDGRETGVDGRAVAPPDARTTAAAAPGEGAAATARRRRTVSGARKTTRPRAAIAPSRSCRSRRWSSARPPTTSEMS